MKISLYLIAIFFSLTLSSQNASWLDDYSELELEVLKEKSESRKAYKAENASSIKRFNPKLTIDPKDRSIILVDWTSIEGNPLNVGIYGESGQLYYISKLHTKVQQIDLSNYDLKPGRYTVELITDESSYMLKTPIN